MFADFLEIEIVMITVTDGIVVWPQMCRKVVATRRFMPPFHITAKTATLCTMVADSPIDFSQTECVSGAKDEENP
jgi:hypothetical protein